MRIFRIYTLYGFCKTVVGYKKLINENQKKNRIT